MGALSDTIKSSANANLEFIDRFLGQPEVPEEQAEARKGIEQLVAGTSQMPAELGETGDIARMKKLLPTSGDEARRHMISMLKLVGGAGLGAGALASLVSHSGALAGRDTLSSLGSRTTVPRREVHVPIGKAASEELEKEAIGPAGLAAGTAAVYGPKIMQSTGFDPMRTIGEKIRGARKYIGELFQPTAEPATHPLFLPAATALGVAGVYGGSKLVGSLLERLRKRRMEREMERAQTEFQQALRAQHTTAKGASAEPCDIYEAIDALSKAFASGELAGQCKSLEKDAVAPTSPYAPAGAHVGKGNVALGTYLSMLALLGLGGVAGGYALGKKFDAPRRRAEALQRALRRRQMAAPPQFVVRHEGEE